MPLVDECCIMIFRVPWFWLKHRHVHHRRLSLLASTMRGNTAVSMLKMSTQQAVVLKRMAAPLVDGRLTRAVMVHTKRGTRQALREARRCGLTGCKASRRTGIGAALTDCTAYWR